MSVVARQVGTEEEFSAFFQTHYNAVTRYVESRVAQREDAAELVADVFRVAWQRFDPGCSRAWLIQVAHNVVLDYYRRNGRRQALISRVADDAASEARQWPGLTEPENPVLAALERLNEPAREVLRLRYWEELSIAEIAEVLGLSGPAVRVRLYRARKQLEPLLTYIPITRRQP